MLQAPGAFFACCSRYVQTQQPQPQPLLQPQLLLLLPQQQKMMRMSIMIQQQPPSKHPLFIIHFSLHIVFGPPFSGGHSTAYDCGENVCIRFYTGRFRHISHGSCGILYVRRSAPVIRERTAMECSAARTFSILPKKRHMDRICPSCVLS